VSEYDMVFVDNKYTLIKHFGSHVYLFEKLTPLLSNNLKINKIFII